MDIYYIYLKGISACRLPAYFPGKLSFTSPPPKKILNITINNPPFLVDTFRLDFKTIATLIVETQLLVRQLQKTIWHGLALIVQAAIIQKNVSAIISSSILNLVRTQQQLEKKGNQNRPYSLPFLILRRKYYHYVIKHFTDNHAKIDGFIKQSS